MALFGSAVPSPRKTEPCLSLDKVAFPGAQVVFVWPKATVLNSQKVEGI